jgi:hypothetical protein
MGAMHESLRQQWMGVALGLLALFVALNGPAVASDAISRTAAKKIVAKDIGKGAVNSAAIQDGTVAGKDIKPGAVTSKHIANATIISSDLSADTKTALKGATGASGSAGAPGSPDTATQVRDKLLTVDGPGSGLNADLLDDLTASQLVADADSAGGDLGGPFSSLQLGTGVVGSTEIGTGAVGKAELDSGGAQGVSLDFPSIPANTCATQAATAGVNPGQIALISVESTPDWGVDGMVVQPSPITTDNRVNFTVCNYTGSMFNPPLTTFRITLIG